MLDRESLATTQNHVKAAVRLSEIFADEEQWPETIEICEKLLNMIDRVGPQGGVSAQILQSVQERYLNALGQETQPDVDVLQQTAEHYFLISSRLFPMEYTMTAQAALRLGEADERSAMHRVDAPAIYQKVIDIAGRASTPGDPTLVKAAATAHERLRTLHRAVASDPKQYSMSTVQKAVGMFLDDYNSSRANQGRSAPSTLNSLEELVTVYHGTGIDQDRTNGLRILQDAAVDTISNETSALR